MAKQMVFDDEARQPGPHDEVPVEGTDGESGGESDQHGDPDVQPVLRCQHSDDQGEHAPQDAPLSQRFADEVGGVERDLEGGQRRSWRQRPSSSMPERSL